MCEMCGGVTTEEYSESTEARLRTYGWTHQYVEGDGERNPGFAYTIGLSQYGHPEIIVFDPREGSAYLCLKPLAWAVLEGSTFCEGDDLSAFFPPPDRVELLAFPDSGTHLFIANSIFRGAGEPPLPALQLVRLVRAPHLLRGR
ncbi:DUF4262 domain-containing protein [Kribbella antibiotica]|uniref:DUF4262 domain-containing protein n=1 Tax=Kribbella antibiotica TaxID=190195 RepID=A0A4R4ZLP0_9ACTN|nr:DUF4262 domain-containing protein [Kribbella antibiotica]TDD59693.1 DUF4262 domain-containing protein [Kribbella antibiotica]